MLGSRKAPLFQGVFFATLLILAVTMPALPQDPKYHEFAAEQTLFGIPNFWNVASNLAFIIVAIFATGNRTSMARIFRAGIFLTGIGSAYYHWHPTTETLFWDRLPMTIGFSAVTAALIRKRVDGVWGQRILWPLVTISAATVIYWRWSEQMGAGNVIPYGVVQFGTVLLVLTVLLAFPQKDKEQTYLWMALAMYVAAKLLEGFDHQIADILVLTAGHPIKHLAAATGCWYLWLGIFRTDC